MSSVVDGVLALLRPSKDGALSFDDAAIDRLIALLRPLEGAALFAAAQELLRTAHFLDVEKKSPAAAGTILTLIGELGPELKAYDAARAQSLSDETAAAAGRLKAFAGDERVTKVLDSGARPAGTTPAGPLARFTVDVKKS